MSSPLARTVSLSALSNPLLQEDATLTRQREGHRERGIFRAFTTVPVDIKVVVAPVDPTVRETLPEGFRESELRTFYTRAEVSTGVEGEEIGDLIRYEGGNYRVVRVHNWGGAFYEAIGTLEDREPPSPVMPLGEFNADFSRDFRRSAI